MASLNAFERHQRRVLGELKEEKDKELQEIMFLQAAGKLKQGVRENSLRNHLLYRIKELNEADHDRKKPTIDADDEDAKSTVSEDGDVHSFVQADHLSTDDDSKPNADLEWYRKKKERSEAMGLSPKAQASPSPLPDAPTDPSSPMSLHLRKSGGEAATAGRKAEEASLSVAPNMPHLIEPPTASFSVPHGYFSRIGGTKGPVLANSPFVKTIRHAHNEADLARKRIEEKRKQRLTGSRGTTEGRQRSAKRKPSADSSASSSTAAHGAAKGPLSGLDRPRSVTFAEHVDTSPATTQSVASLDKYGTSDDEGSEASFGIRSEGSDTVSMQMTNLGTSGLAELPQASATGILDDKTKAATVSAGMLSVAGREAEWKRTSTTLQRYRAPKFDKVVAKRPGPPPPGVRSVAPPPEFDDIYGGGEEGRDYHYVEEWHERGSVGDRPSTSQSTGAFQDSAADLDKGEYMAGMSKMVMERIRESFSTGLLYLPRMHLANIPAIALNTFVAQLGYLQELHLPRNNIEHITPAQMRQMQRLKVLNLYRNKLKTLHREIGLFSSLTHLDVSYNELYHIPWELGVMTQLKRLHFDWNKLERLPPLQIPGLQVLTAPNNRLGMMPVGLATSSALRELDLSHNMIVSLAICPVVYVIPDVDLKLKPAEWRRGQHPDSGQPIWRHEETGAFRYSDPEVALREAKEEYDTLREQFKLVYQGTYTGRPVKYTVQTASGLEKRKTSSAVGQSAGVSSAGPTYEDESMRIIREQRQMQRKAWQYEKDNPQTGVALPPPVLADTGAGVVAATDPAERVQDAAAEVVETKANNEEQGDDVGAEGGEETGTAVGAMVVPPLRKFDELLPEPDVAPSTDGWQAFWDDSNNAYYYYNHNTGDMQWEEPPNYDHARAQAAAAQYGAEYGAEYGYQEGEGYQQYYYQDGTAIPYDANEYPQSLQYVQAGGDPAAESAHAVFAQGADTTEGAGGEAGYDAQGGYEYDWEGYGYNYDWYSGHYGAENYFYDASATGGVVSPTKEKKKGGSVMGTGSSTAKRSWQRQREKILRVLQKMGRGEWEVCLNKLSRKVDYHDSGTGRTYCTLPPQLDTIGELHHLKRLNLAYNRLQELPPSFKGLTRLEKLYLKCNSLKVRSFPEDLTGLRRSLSFLDISQCAIRSFPESLTYATMLKHLDMQSNKMKTIPPSFSRLVNLKTLWANDNRISMLPTTFTLLTALEDLRLVGNSFNDEHIKFMKKGIRHLFWYLRQLQNEKKRGGKPPEVTFQAMGIDDECILAVPQYRQWLHLQVDSAAVNKKLQLQFRGLTTLPNVVLNRIDEISDVAEVTIVGNNIREIPFTLSYFTNVRRLTLRANRTEKMMDRCLESMTRVRMLSLEDNIMTQLPDSFSVCNKIVTLKLSQNRFRLLPRDFGRWLPKVQVLWLDSNDLGSIPDSICECSNLRLLSLNKNRLNSLPDELYRLTRLHTLRLFDNQLPDIPHVCLRMRIRELNLASNRISSIPPLLFGSRLSRYVRKLWLQNNLISMLPDDFHELEGIPHFRLDGNTKMTIPPQDVVMGGIRAMIAYSKIRSRNVVMIQAAGMKYGLNIDEMSLTPKTVFPVTGGIGLMTEQHFAGIEDRVDRFVNINCHTTHDSADKIISDLVDMRGAFVDKYRKRVFEKFMTALIACAENGWIPEAHFSESVYRPWGPRGTFTRCYAVSIDALFGVGTSSGNLETNYTYAKWERENQGLKELLERREQRAKEARRDAAQNRLEKYMLQKRGLLPEPEEGEEGYVEEEEEEDERALKIGPATADEFARVRSKLKQRQAQIAQGQVVTAEAPNLLADDLDDGEDLPCRDVNDGKTAIGAGFGGVGMVPGAPSGDFMCLAQRVEAMARAGDKRFTGPLLTLSAVYDSIAVQRGYCGMVASCGDRVDYSPVSADFLEVEPGQGLPSTPFVDSDGELDTDPDEPEEPDDIDALVKADKDKAARRSSADTLFTAEQEKLAKEEEERLRKEAEEQGAPIEERKTRRTLLKGSRAKLLPSRRWRCGKAPVDVASVREISATDFGGLTAHGAASLMRFSAHKRHAKPSLVVVKYFFSPKDIQRELKEREAFVDIEKHIREDATIVFNTPEGKVAIDNVMHLRAQMVKDQLLAMQRRMEICRRTLKLYNSMALKLAKQRMSIAHKIRAKELKATKRKKDKQAKLLAKYSTGDSTRSIGSSSSRVRSPSAAKAKGRSKSQLPRLDSKSSNRQPAAKPTTPKISEKQAKVNAAKRRAAKAADKSHGRARSQSQSSSRSLTHGGDSDVQSIEKAFRQALRNLEDAKAEYLLCSAYVERAGGKPDVAWKLKPSNIDKESLKAEMIERKIKRTKRRYLALCRLRALKGGYHRWWDGVDGMDFERWKRRVTVTVGPDGKNHYHVPELEDPDEEEYPFNVSLTDDTLGQLDESEEEEESSEEEEEEEEGEEGEDTREEVEDITFFL